MSKDDVRLRIELSENTQNQSRSQGNPASSARPATGSDGPQPVAPGGSNKNPLPDPDEAAPPGAQQVDVGPGSAAGGNGGTSPITDAHRRPAPYKAEFADPTVETETGATEEGWMAAGAASEGAASILLPLAVSVGAAVKVFDILSDTAHALDNSFQDMIRRGSQWNAQIGVAAEIGELKLMFAEMERANKLSNELSDYGMARSDLAVEIKRLGTDVSKKLLPLATDVVHMLRGSVLLLKQVAANLPDKDKMEGIIAVLPAAGSFGALANLLREISANTKKGEMDELQGFDSQWQRFLTPHLMTSSVQPASKFNR